MVNAVAQGLQCSTFPGILARCFVTLLASILPQNCMAISWNQASLDIEDFELEPKTYDS